MAQDRDDEKTGHDLPDADGTLSDEDVNAITDQGEDKPTGQDHSLENYADTMPDGGVGAVQDSSIIRNDIADIEEE